MTLASRPALRVADAASVREKSIWEVAIMVLHEEVGNGLLDSSTLAASITVISVGVIMFHARSLSCRPAAGRFTLVRMRRVSSTLKRAIAGLLALWLLMLQLPISMPVLGSNGKDLSIPFPCMHRACGCRSAAECWKSCCCTTKAERIAFAKSHGVAIPKDVEEAMVDVAPAKRACCATHSKTCDAGTRAKSRHEETAHDTVVLSAVMRCWGLGVTMLQFAGVAVSIPQMQVRSVEPMIVWTSLTDDSLTFVELSPPTPPPRLAVA
jgi:hypothetical protein